MDLWSSIHFSGTHFDLRPCRNHSVTLLPEQHKRQRNKELHKKPEFTRSIIEDGRPWPTIHQYSPNGECRWHVFMFPFQGSPRGGLPQAPWDPACGLSQLAMIPRDPCGPEGCPRMCTSTGSPLKVSDHATVNLPAGEVPGRCFTEGPGGQPRHWHRHRSIMIQAIRTDT